MKPKNAKKEFGNLIKQSGVPMGNLTPAQGVRLMLDFYRDVPVEGCDPEGGDMLLFQWGVFDFGDGEFFQIDITRQFTLEDAGGDEDMSQLSFTFYFDPTEELAKIEDGDRWCESPAELREQEAFISGFGALHSVFTAKPKRVTLEYDTV